MKASGWVVNCVCVCEPETSCLNMRHSIKDNQHSAHLTPHSESMKHSSFDL